MYSKHIIFLKNIILFINYIYNFIYGINKLKIAPPEISSVYYCGGVKTWAFAFSLSPTLY